LELKYSVKIFQQFGYTKDCYDLTEQFIKLAWGNHFPLNFNIVNKKCKFQGGSLKNHNTPKPAIQAFELFKESLTFLSSLTLVIKIVRIIHGNNLPLWHFLLW
jgi:hypothetical protein